MTQYLPPNLLVLFAAREPITYLPPIDVPSSEKKRKNYTGISNFVDALEPSKKSKPTEKTETKEERAERRAYETSESKLKKEFGVFGRIRCIRIIHNIETGKPRGYAFIEYEKESDMHDAYKYADGRKIDGRRVAVDVERGRTVKGWKPRRLAGGLGNTRRAIQSSKKEESKSINTSQQKYPSPEYQENRRYGKSTNDSSRDFRPRYRHENSRRRSRSKSRDRHSKRYMSNSHYSPSRTSSKDYKRSYKHKSPSKSPKMRDRVHSNNYQNRSTAETTRDHLNTSNYH